VKSAMPVASTTDIGVNATEPHVQSITLTAPDNCERVVGAVTGTAGSPLFGEVRDKGKPGESRGRKATRLPRDRTRARPVEPPNHIR
jgi:hypothetical protein